MVKSASGVCQLFWFSVPPILSQSLMKFLIFLICYICWKQYHCCFSTVSRIHLKIHSVWFPYWEFSLLFTSSTTEKTAFCHSQNSIMFRTTITEIGVWLSPTIVTTKTQPLHSVAYLFHTFVSSVRERKGEREGGRERDTHTPTHRERGRDRDRGCSCGQAQRQWSSCTRVCLRFAASLNQGQAA